MKKWAKNEVKLAIEENRTDHNEELDWVYRTALELYRSLVNKVSEPQKPIEAVRVVFDQLMDKNPLTPIEDVEEDWVVIEEKVEYSIYQNKRRLSLLKKKTKEGNVIFNDTDRVRCIDVDSGKSYNGEAISLIVNEMFPIIFPYEPLGKIKVFTEDFKYHKDNDLCDYDTVGILDVLSFDGELRKINRFFKYDPKTNQMVEIDQQEYYARKEGAACKGMNKK